MQQGVCGREEGNNLLSYLGEGKAMERRDNGILGCDHPPRSVTRVRELDVAAEVTKEEQSENERKHCFAL